MNINNRILASSLIFCILVFASLMTLESKAQNTIYHKDKGDKIWHIQDVDIRPVFPGGEEELLKFVNSKLSYPKRSKNKNKEGIV